MLKNKSVQGPQLLVCLYSIIENGIKMSTKIRINDEKEARDYGASAQDLAAQEIKRKTVEEYKEATVKIEMHWHKGNQTVDKKVTQEISGRVLAAFGLQCLRKALKHKELIKSGGVDVENMKQDEVNDVEHQ